MMGKCIPHRRSRVGWPDLVKPSTGHAGRIAAVAMAAAVLLTVVHPVDARAAERRLDQAAKAIISTAGPSPAGLVPARATEAQGTLVMPADNLATGVRLVSARTSVTVRHLAASGRATVHRDGMLVSATTLPATTAAARLKDGGLQLLTVLESAAAPAQAAYRFDLPAGAQLIPTGQGGYAIAGPDAVYGTISPPWAIDAAGRRLPTRYVAMGDTLIQRIDLTGAVFPVVADPYVTIGRYIYVTFRKAEVRRVLRHLPNARAVATFACALVPHPLAKAACALAVNLFANQITTVFKRARNRNECARLYFRYLTSPVRYGGAYVYNC
jgi:hypothetical protein